MPQGSIRSHSRQSYRFGEGMLTIILTGPHPKIEGLSGTEINAQRLWNGAKALSMLPSLIASLERAAALLPNGGAEQARAYQAAWEARALLEETP